MITEKIKKISKILTAISISLCIILSLYVKNIFFLACMFIGIDFVFTISEWIIFKVIINENCKTREDYNDLMDKWRYEDFFCKKEILDYLYKKKEKIIEESNKEKRNADEVVNFFEDKVEKDILELKEINEKLFDSLKFISENTDILITKKQIKKHLKNIEQLIDKDPYKINIFLSKYRVVANGLIECINLYKNSIDKEKYSVKLNILLDEVSEYLNNTEERLMLEEQTNIDSLMNVLITELKKENEK